MLSIIVVVLNAAEEMHQLFPEVRFTQGSVAYRWNALNDNEWLLYRGRDRSIGMSVLAAAQAL